MILIDSNVLLDIAGRDPNWFEWSSERVAEAADEYELCINPIIYAEASTKYSNPSDFDSAFPPDEFIRKALPYPAAFLAGKAHASYRRRGGTRAATLPDFFIGAHALVMGYKILTRDPRRFRQYFPGTELIAP